MPNSTTTVSTDEPPLPPPATVAELRAPERQAQLDPMHPLEDFQAKGLNDCFEGRHDELQQLTHIFIGAGASAGHGGDKAYSALLFGSPGGGKSALKDYWRELYRSRRHAVLQVTAEAFASGAALRDALMDTDEWRTATMLNRAAETAGRVVGEIGTAGAEAIGELVRTQSGDEIPPEMISLLGGLLRLGAARPTTWKDCTAALSGAFEGGWTIAVDEAEDLDRYLDRDETRVLLKTVGDPSQRPDDAGKGGLLLAGLSDTVHTVDAYRLTRLHKIRMGALLPSDAMAIVQTAIDGSDMRTAVRDALRARWTRTLARDFHHWPHHTRCAAVAVVHAAQLADDHAKRHGAKVGTDFDPILEHVRTWAANGAAMLYRDRWRTSRKLSNVHLPGEVVALARACGGPMHETQVLKLIDERMASVRRIGRKVTAEPEEWLQGLAHGGLIEPVILDDNADSVGDPEIEAGHYRIAIPSMARHIEVNSVTSPHPERIQRARASIEPESQAETEELIRQAEALRVREEMPPEAWETATLPIREAPFALPAEPAVKEDGDTDD